MTYMITLTKKCELAALACLIPLLVAANPATAQDVSMRTLKICVASDAPAAVQESAKAILDGVSASPLLSAMASGSASLVDSAKLAADQPASRAFHHLVLVGLPNDPMIRQAWQQEARVEDNGLYVYDFGHFRGDIGYVESDRNPFLHGAAIKMAPFETEVITITGATPQGVAAAADAFLKHGLINGVVAGAGWQRGNKTILDHDPLAADFSLPAWVPAQAGKAVRVGITQAGESEYRGVESDTGVAPRVIWRCKYYTAGDWDGPGRLNALKDYIAGLHRRAVGNTLWLAQFASVAEADAAAQKIAQAAGLHRTGDRWAGSQALTANADVTGGWPLTLWRQQEWVLMSSLDSFPPTK